MDTEVSKIVSSICNALAVVLSVLIVSITIYHISFYYMAINSGMEMGVLPGSSQIIWQYPKKDIEKTNHAHE